MAPAATYGSMPFSSPPASQLVMLHSRLEHVLSNVFCLLELLTFLIGVLFVLGETLGARFLEFLPGLSLMVLGSLHQGILEAKPFSLPPSSVAGQNGDGEGDDI